MNPRLSSVWNIPQLSSVDVALSQSTLSIRPATLEDARALATVLTHSFHHYQGTWGWLTPLLRLGVYEDLHHRLKQTKEHHACFVAAMQTATAQEIVGTVEISVRYLNALAIAPAKAPYISNLAVNPQYRRLGIARKLLARCETQVRYWHYGSVALHVLENNEAAKQLYLSCGYDIKYAERPLSAWLLRRPRRLFVQKSLSP
ncbi:MULTISPECIES: GNAT family N-acetyltransferase [Cyanophyceae]|uniref:GNAT family N-acetyltransferase n=1 Tax=Cyanophyceae TaxID=3028117 RepID=UPI00059DE376|nr:MULTISPECIES: N-acetyltransferase [Cyanophyceae]QCS50151.1 GNAT family N-acetyltransferase [Picosynechococcus sp. PCC 11901]SMH29242.1 Ribosomal protein S18 acetylase RimI [Picosynechococcus sp. OG1]SMQ83676.1 Ribosomal protein S18 acetylase RimI [Synechococcus sp. 7002]